jgi:hypothetical protein
MKDSETTRCFRRKQDLESHCLANGLSAKGNTVQLLKRLKHERVITETQFKEFQKHAKGKNSKEIKCMTWNEEQINTVQEITKEKEDNHKQESKTIVHTLKKAIDISDPIIKSRVIDRIDNGVLSISKMMRKASLFATLHFNRVCSEHSTSSMFPASGWTDTEWRHCMLIGNDGYTEAPKDSAIDISIYDTYSAFSHLFPPIPIDSGLSQSVTFAAKDLATAFKRCLWSSTIPYLKRYIKAWLENVWDVVDHPKDIVKVKLTSSKRKQTVKLSLKCVALERPSVLQLLRAIETGNLKSDYLDYPLTIDFVKKTRNSLGIHDADDENNKPKKVTDSFLKLKDNMATMFSFKRNLQERFDYLGKKNIPLCPIFKAKRHFITLDPSSCKNILKTCGYKCPKVEDDDWLRDVFVLPRNNDKMIWTKTLRTDGVSAHMVYEKTTRKQPDTLKIQKPSTYPKEEDTIVIGADPGCTNTITLSFEYKGNTKSWMLTRKQYYALSGITAAHRRKQERIEKEQVQGLWDRLTKLDGCIRTPRLDKIVKYIEANNDIHEAWWEFAGKKVDGKDRLRTHGGRKRVLDVFFEKVSNDTRNMLDEKDKHKKIVIAYGAACFSPSGKGRLTTPTTAVYKACMRHFSTYKQGECRTSKQHHRCFGDVQSCWTGCEMELKVNETSKDKPIELCITPWVHHGMKVPKEFTYLRGLQYCSKCDRYLNRDKNSALCIAKLFIITKLRGDPEPQAFKPRYRSCCNHATQNSPP